MRTRRNKDVEHHCTCYAKVVSGWASLGYAYTGGKPRPTPRLDLLRFRDWVFARHKIQPLQQPRRPRLLLLEKDVKQAVHKTYIANAPQLAANLSAALGLPVKRAMWGGMTVLDQARVMANTDVVISLPGADIINCVFMPTHSAMIVPHRPRAWSFTGEKKPRLRERKDQRGPEGIRWEDSNEIRLWFNLLPFRVLLSWSPVDDSMSTWTAAGAVHLAPSVVQAK
eukprot:5021977-Prymnesium_polylepis.1